MRQLRLWTLPYIIHHTSYTIYLDDFIHTQFLLMTHTSKILQYESSVIGFGIHIFRGRKVFEYSFKFQQKNDRGKTATSTIDI